jgi:2-oxoglutarate ferredoxin oxidoreductase subunit delta
MARAVGTVRIETESCKGCELCIPVCPPRVLEMSAERNRLGFRFPVLLEGCTGCELCAEICPDYCFEVFRAVLPARAGDPAGKAAP